jgi:hypothetical protein
MNTADDRSPDSSTISDSFIRIDTTTWFLPIEEISQ